MGFATSGIGITDGNGLAILNKQAAGTAYRENVIYRASPKVILDAVLRKAAGMNRYLYTAATVGVFDTAYANAQSAYNNPSSADADYTAAAQALRAAIAGLVLATFGAPKSLLAKVGKIVDLREHTSYDGIGTPVLKSSSISGVVGIRSDWKLVPMKIGTSVITIEVVETGQTILFAVSVST